MKKIFVVLATVAVMTLAASCGARHSQVEAGDVDSTLVETADSTLAAADSTVAVADSVVAE